MLFIHQDSAVAWSGLLEVNLSPALRHSSKHQSAIIRSMCEGLLRLTVDRIFPAAQSSTSNVGVDHESLASETPRRTGTPEVGRGREEQANQVHLFGKWRPITTTTPSGSKKEQSETLSSSLDGKLALDTRVSVRNPSAQVFSLRGRHLTRRSLARAERGVREATAVKVLTAWWRSTAEERRKKRCRKLCAIAEINTWIAKLIVPRRAQRANSERSASVIQALWRQASVRMSETRNLVTACIVVQTMWKRWQLNQRCSSRRIHRKVSSGLHAWARAVLCRRQKAGKTIYRAVIAATMRQKGKRHAAAVIVGGLKMACNRRRRSRVQLQRFARMPCLLQVRLAALFSARVSRVHNKAATIVARAVRRGLTRSCIIRATLAVRTLQCWSRKILRRWKDRYAATVMIQQAWRQAKQRRIRSIGKLGCMADDRFRRPSKNPAVAVAAAAVVSTTNAPVCKVALGKVASDVSRSWSVGTFIPRSSFEGTTTARSLQSTRSSTRTYSTAKEHVTRGLPVAFDGEHETSLASGNELLSPATTTRGESTDPDLCLGGGGMQTCHSHSFGDSILSYNEGRCRTVVTIREPGSYPGTTTSCDPTVENGERLRCSTPRTVGPKKEKVSATQEPSGGILHIEDILPNFIRYRENTLLEGKRHGRCEVHRQHIQSNGVRHTTKRVNESGGLGDAPAATGDYFRHMGFPYPPAGGAQPINTRTSCIRRLARRQKALGKADASTKPVSHTFSGRNHRGIVTGSTDCSPSPLRFGFLVGPRDVTHKPSTGRNRIPTAKPVSWFTSAKCHSRRSQSSRPVRATDVTKRRVGMQSFRRGSTTLRDRGGSIRCKGDSGGVLEMLAFMEA